MYRVNEVDYWAYVMWPTIEMSPKFIDNDTIVYNHKTKLLV